MSEAPPDLGLQLLATAAEVDVAMRRPGFTLVFVDADEDCARNSAHPGLALALAQTTGNARAPQQRVTVFGPGPATDRVREYLRPYPPLAPQIVLMQDGMLLAMLGREELLGCSPTDVAKSLSDHFESFCS